MSPVIKSAKKCQALREIFDQLKTDLVDFIFQFFKIVKQSQIVYNKRAAKIIAKIIKI